MRKQCKICGAETRKLHHPRLEADYHCCPACEFISKDESALISPQEEMERYDKHQNSIEDRGYVEYFKKFLDKAVVEYAGMGRKGLDFGSGPSPVLAQILERDYGYSMDIYDLFYSPEKVYTGKKYDLVTSTEVVEHLKDPLEYFRMFKELLEDDGILAIMTLFHHDDDQHFIDWNYIRDKSHISFYTPKTLGKIAEIVGLEVVYSDEVRCTTFSETAAE